MLKFITIFLTVIGVSQIEGACKTCNKHGFACIDEKSFQICIDGKIGESETLQCKTDEICTDLSMICVARANSTAVPGCSSLCGVCEVGKTFACTSRRTYGLCRDGVLTDISGSCPSDKVCDTTGSSVCVRPCDVNNLICDADTIATTTELTSELESTSLSSSSTPTTSSSPQTPSPTSPMTPTPAPLPTSSPTESEAVLSTPTPAPTATPTPTKTPQDICQKNLNPGRYPFDDDTNGCSNEYVYCRFDGSSLIGIPSKCPSGRSFDKTTQSCQITPSVCSV